jgi:hypothetical protein
MRIGEYTAAVFDGARSFGRAALHWRQNPFTARVMRRLWGPLPWIGLGGLAVFGIVVSPIFPSPGRIAGFFPPVAVLLWIPEDVIEMLWSVPACFGYLVAWRVSSFRRDDPSRWLGSADVNAPELRLFEAAAVPVAAAGLALAIGIEVAAPVQRLLEGAPPGWPSAGSAMLAVSRSLVVVAVVSGVMSVHRSVSKGLGQVLGAAFMLFGLRLAIGYTVPWMTAWWTYLPIPFIDRVGGDRSPVFALFLFNLAVAAIAWVMTMGTAEDSPFWTAKSEDGAPNTAPHELPPLPTSDRSPNDRP